MRGGVFDRLLRRYGQTAEIVRMGEEAGVPVRAFLQPIRELRTSVLPSPLGVGRRDRFLYLGEPEIPPGEPGTGWVRWQGRTLDIVNAQAIRVGERISHWWAVLEARDEDEEEAEP